MQKYFVRELSFLTQNVLVVVTALLRAASGLSIWKPTHLEAKAATSLRTGAHTFLSSFRWKKQ